MLDSKKKYTAVKRPCSIFFCESFDNMPAKKTTSKPKKHTKIVKTKAGKRRVPVQGYRYAAGGRVVKAKKK